MICWKILRGAGDSKRHDTYLTDGRIDISTIAIYHLDQQVMNNISQLYELTSNHRIIAFFYMFANHKLFL